MKRILSVILVAALLLCLGIHSAAAEDVITRPHIVYTFSGRSGVYGLVNVPEGGTYWAMISGFVRDEGFLVYFVPIEEGEFFACIIVEEMSIKIQIVDSPCAVASGMYTVYETLNIPWD